MSEKPCQMIDDTREISQISSEGAWFCTGDMGITKIEIYQEPGQMAMQNWAAVYCGDFLYARVCLAGWTVFYKRDDLYLTGMGG